MDSQQVYEKFRDIVSGQLGVPTAAARYVAGDDSQFEYIPTKSVMLWSYPKELLDEVDGEGGETAKRALRAIGRMSYSGMLMNCDFGVLKRIGYSLEEILNENFQPGYWHNNGYYSAYGKSLYELYADEAEKLITPSYLNALVSSQNKMLRTLHVSFFIAGHLFVDGRGDVKGLREQINYYSSHTEGDIAALILSEVYEHDKSFEERLKELLCDPDVIFRLIGAKTNDFVMELCDKLGLLRYYLYTAITCGYTGKAAEASEQKVVENAEELLPWMFGFALNRCSGRKTGCVADVTDKVKGAVNKIMRLISGNVANASVGEVKLKNPDKKYVHELCRLAHVIALTIQSGSSTGIEVLGEYEKQFGLILGSISDVYNIDESGFPMNADSPEKGIRTAHIIYDDPEKAASLISFNANTNLRRHDSSMAFVAFSALYNYSKKAHDIVWAFIKSAEYFGNVNGYKRAGELINILLTQESRLGIDVNEGTDRLLSDGIPLNIYFMGAVLTGTDTYSYIQDKVGFEALPDIVKAHIEEAAAFYPFIKDDAKAAAFWAELLYKKSGCSDIPLLLSMLKSKSKVVRRIASEVMISREEDIRQPLEELLPKLKGEALAGAQAVIKKWDNNKKYGKDFSFGTNALAEEYVAENPNPAAMKKLAFIPEEYFCDVRFADLEGKASKALIKYIIGEYLVLDEPYRISVCDKLAARLYPADLHACMENIYQYWLENGADNKTKMIMVPYCVYASDTQILALKKQLTAWADAQRGALGAFVINAVAVNGGSTALMMVNDIAAKFSSNQIKKAAKAAFSYAAKVLELPEDVLADRIVPNLGLDRNGEKILDFGARTFTLSLMPDFTLSIYDNDKKKAVKSLPKPAASDDAVKAEEAKKYVSELKKQLKAVTAAQKNRLEAVFRNGRTWDCEAWNALFVENPVMHRFASTLIWGVYEEGELVSTFRYCEDGSFCDENDDVFELPENALISLVHPIELESDTIEAWQEQLSDYEITQPFAQISASVITLSDDDIGENGFITKYSKRSFTVSSMNNAAKKYNFIRSSVEDGGGFSGYHIQDRVLGIGMEFGFENMYMGQDYSETLELDRVFIYLLPENDEVPNSYNEYPAISPKGVSKRFISCCLGILEGILD